MASVKYDTRIRDLLLEAYSKKYGRSPSRLINALNDRYRQHLEIIRRQKGGEDSNLMSDKTIRNFFGESPPAKIQESSLNYLCDLLLEYPSYQDAIDAIQALENSKTNYIDREALNLYQQSVRELYGQIKVLDMRDAVPLERLYIEPRLSETLRSEQQRTFEGLQEIFDTSHQRNCEKMMISSLLILP